MKIADYFSKSQIRDFKSTKQIAKVPVCVFTSGGLRYFNGEKTEAIPKRHYAVSTHDHSFAILFFKKASRHGKKGVILYWQEVTPPDTIAPIQFFGEGHFNSWFIAPDWSAWDEESGDRIDFAMEACNSFALYCSVARFKYLLANDRAFDANFVADISPARTTSPHRGCLAPTTVKTLEEAGFDMSETSLTTCELLDAVRFLPNDAFPIKSIKDSLVHPKAVALRRKKKAKDIGDRDYHYFDQLIGEGAFGGAVDDSDGKFIVAFKDVGWPGCVFVSSVPRGGAGGKPKKPWMLTPHGSMQKSGEFVYNHTKGECVESCRFAKSVIGALLSKKESLAETPLRYYERAFESAMRTLDNDEDAVAATQNIGYLVCDGGWRDLTFETFAKKDLLSRVPTAEAVIASVGCSYEPDFSQTLPWKQVGLRKDTYYGIVAAPRMMEAGIGCNHRLEDSVFGISTWAIVKLLNQQGWEPKGEEERKKQREFALMITPDLLMKGENPCHHDDIFALFTYYGKADKLPFNGERYGCDGVREDLAGPRIAIEYARMAKKYDQSPNSAPTGALADYYRSIFFRRTLEGVEWPMKREDFHRTKVMDFLDHFPEEYEPDVAAVKIAKASQLEHWRGPASAIAILHALQNRIFSSDYRSMNTLKALDKAYAPVRDKLNSELKWEGNGVEIFAPESISELQDEGRELNHCVGSYMDTVSQGKRGILFMRRTSAPSAPWFTIDVLKSRSPDCEYRINQVHGFANCDPDDEAYEALREWASEKGCIEMGSVRKSYGMYAAGNPTASIM